MSGVRAHYRTLSCQVPDERLSTILGHVLANRADLRLADFAFRDTSLDEAGL